jgi:hypothetical protein
VDFLLKLTAHTGEPPGRQEPWMGTHDSCLNAIRMTVSVLNIECRRGREGHPLG